jgi:hypothetical protein
MDEAGTTLSTGTVEHTAEGLERFMAAVRARAQTAHGVLVALETPHGPLVGALLDQGFTVYAINPKAVERHRDRARAGESSLRYETPCCTRRHLRPASSVVLGAYPR